MRTQILMNLDEIKKERSSDGKLTERGRRLVSQDILTYIHREVFDDKRAILQSRLQEWTDKSDMPAASTLYPLVSRFLETADSDEGWRLCFKLLDFTNVRKSGFRLFTLTNSITPALVPPGGKAKVYSVAGSTATVPFDKYGAALEWDKTLFEDDEWVQLQDIIVSFTAEFKAMVAQTHYDLIEAIGNAKAAIAWQAPDPAALLNSNETYTANRDSETINLAAQTLILANMNKGYGVTAASPLILLAPLQLRKRARKALNLLLQPVTNSPTNNDYNITLVTTTMLTTVDHFRMVLPGNKLQSGNRMNLEELRDVDILARSEIMADWLRFGCACGDTDQIETLDIV